MEEKKYRAIVIKIDNEYLGIKEDENGNFPENVSPVDKVIGTLSKIEELVSAYNSQKEDPNKKNFYPCDKII